MIEEPITNAEKKYLLTKVAYGTLLGLLLLCLPLLLFCLLEFDHIKSFWLFVLIKYLAVGLWSLCLVLLMIKALGFSSSLLRNKIKKVSAEFTLTHKESCTTTFDTGSDSHYGYIHIMSAQQIFRLQVDVQDYECIIENDLVRLHYFSHIYLLISAEYRGSPLSVIDATPRSVFPLTRLFSRR